LDDLFDRFDLGVIVLVLTIAVVGTVATTAVVRLLREDSPATTTIPSGERDAIERTTDCGELRGIADTYGVDVDSVSYYRAARDLAVRRYEQFNCDAIAKP
jgi:hypothetical protein